MSNLTTKVVTATYRKGAQALAFFQEKNRWPGVSIEMPLPDLSDIKAWEKETNAVLKAFAKKHNLSFKPVDASKLLFDASKLSYQSMARGPLEKAFGDAVTDDDNQAEPTKTAIADI